MKSPVIFRATFQQPKAKFRMHGDIEVEIYHSKIGPPPEWRARRPGTTLDFPNITPQSRANTLMEQIENLSFDRRVSDWKAFDSQEPGQAALERWQWNMDQAGNVTLTEAYKENKKSTMRLGVAAGLQKQQARDLAIVARLAGGEARGQETEHNCHCDFSDAWRCARARRLGEVACTCVCHRSRAGAINAIRVARGEEKHLKNENHNREYRPDHHA